MMAFWVQMLKLSGPVNFDVEQQLVLYLLPMVISLNYRYLRPKRFVIKIIFWFWIFAYLVFHLPRRNCDCANFYEQFDHFQYVNVHDNETRWCIGCNANRLCCVFSSLLHSRILGIAVVYDPFEMSHIVFHPMWNDDVAWIYDYVILDLKERERFETL